MTDPTRPPSDLVPASDDGLEALEGQAGQLPDSPEGSTDPPRLQAFSLEGRSVPALYLIGWVGTVMGLAVLLVSFLASGTGSARWLFLAGLAVLGVGLVSATGSQAVERTRRRDLPYRGPSPVLAFVVVIAVTLLLIVVVIAPLTGIGLDAASPMATSLSLLLTTVAYLVVVRVLVVGPGALTWSEMGVTRPDGAAGRELLYGAVFALPVLVVTLLISAALGTFLERTPSPLPDASDTVGLVFNLVSAAVLAPIGEEIFFRGFATTAWFRALGGARPAIVRGAIFFALAHVLTLFDASFAVGVQRAAFSFLALLPIGIALGWLFLARRSLYTAIGLHAAFNAIQVLLLFLAGNALST